VTYRLSIGFLLVALASLCAGCTRISTQSSPGHGNSWTIPGVLRIGARQEPDTLNPVLGQQEIDVDIAMFWAGFMFEYDNRGRFIPDLATEVPTVENGGISKDGRAITYHLRRGVTWQDGAAFTTDDVIFTWRTVMNRRNPVPSRVGYELIDSITKIGGHTLVVRLKRPYAPFVDAFFTPVSAYGYCILPSHLLARYPDINHNAFNLMPVGTGPYRVVRYEPDNLVQLVANPHYWRGPPHLRKVNIRVVPNDNTLSTLIKTHEIDLYFRAPHQIVRALRGLAGTTMVSSVFTRWADLGFNTASPILSDVHVRRALAYATDKKAIVRKLSFGEDMIADSDQPPFLWAHNANVPKYQYDPTRAAALLDSAGWRLGPDGIRQRAGASLRIGLAGAAGDATSIAARELLQAQWRQIGVETEIKSYPSDILYASLSEGGIEQSGHFDAVLEGFANGLDPDDSVLFECRWEPPAGQNVYRYCDPKLDAVEETALANNDMAKRKAAYARIQNILAEQVPIIVLWFDRYDFAVNSDLRHFAPSHVGSPFWNTWQLEI
jgi:peptide/nickel transport system substrate-binding protein